jgi:uncharacterized repeat protein (TIGR02543 family)
MNVSIIDSVFTENDIGVYTDVTNPASTVAVTSNDISGNRWIGVQLDEGNADFAYNDITNNGVNGVVAIAGAYGVSDIQSTFLQNVITGNGGISPASGAIRLADHSGSDLSMSANLTFTNNAILSNTGTTVANLSAAGVITGTGTWWGIAGQPLDVSGTFTADLATLSDALATDASDAAYGFIVSSVAIDSSVDLPPLTIASSDRTAMPTPISIDFGAISGGGTVTVVPSVQAAEGNISFGVNPSVIDIDFTGTFTGSVEVCIGYDPAQYYAGSSILLFHYIGGAWVDVTSSVNESTRRVCGLVSSFSPFAAGEELAVYTITYDANDGTLAGGEDTSYTFGEAAMTAPSNPTRTGYEFVGWFRDDITFATSAFPLTPTGDTTVYAKWNLITDATPPTTTSLVARVAEGVQVGSTVPVLLNWTGTDEESGSGIATYDVREAQSSRGRWRIVATSLIAPSYAPQIQGVGSTLFQVRAIDHAGNIGTWSSSISIRPQLLRDSMKNIRYTPGRMTSWITVRNQSVTDGAAHVAIREGATAMFTLACRSIGILAATGPDAGVMSISVDGTIVATVNLWAPAVAVRQVIWQQHWDLLQSRRIVLIATTASREVQVQFDGIITLQ